MSAQDRVQTRTSVNPLRRSRRVVAPVDEMPTPHVFETDQARSTDDPLDVTLRAALNDQLPSRHKNRSQVPEEPVMVAYPMKGCRGEHRIDRVVVGEDLRIKGQQISPNEPGFRSPRPKTLACLIEHRGGCVEGYDPSIRYPRQQLLRYSSCTAARIQNDLRPVEIKLVKDRLPPTVLGISNAVVTLPIPARRSRRGSTHTMSPYRAPPRSAITSVIGCLGEAPIRRYLEWGCGRLGLTGAGRRTSLLEFLVFRR